jgi:phosphoribosyl 1,2-cyclic phosphodiesterase
MSASLDVRFWGTRGSLPVPGPLTHVYGGSTSCVEVRANGHVLVFDAGTGIRELGGTLMESGKPPPVHLFFSHYHWDHIMGFPFFTPIYVPGAELHLYGETKNGQSVLEILSGQMHPPYFPIKWNMVNATVDWTPVEPDKDVHLGDVTVKTCRLNHPQDALAYRVEYGGRSVVYATDIEHGSDLDSEFVDFIRDADVLIMDCSFTGVEYPSRRGWGHASWEAGAEFADKGGVDTFVMFHHLPERTDAEVAAIEAEAQAKRPNTVAAREGMTFHLPAK